MQLSAAEPVAIPGGTATRKDTEAPAAATRPSTPPPAEPAHPAINPSTPEPSNASNSASLRVQPVPRTPSGPGSSYPHPASVYLSSPIRRAKHHHSAFAAGTMTPGRPSLKHGGGSRPGAATVPFSPFRARQTASTVAPDSGQVDLGDPTSMGSLPLQTVMMTSAQAKEITDLDAAKDTLVRAIEESEQFRKAAHHFRTLAAHHAFQHRILEIERTEAERRYGVEVNIQQKEIEKLLVDIMGFDRSMDSDQVRRRLKRTKHRLRELEEVLAERNARITELQNIVGQFARFQSMPYLVPGSMPVPGPAGGLFPGQQLPEVPPALPNPANLPGSGVLPGNAHQPMPFPTANNPATTTATATRSSHSRTSSDEGYARSTRSEPFGTATNTNTTSNSATASPEKPRPPRIDTHLPIDENAASSEPLSALEVLASQVLSSGIQPHSAPGLGSATPSAVPPSVYTSSPYSSPFVAPFSPFAVPPQLTRTAPTSVPQFGSPEKRRRPSSSSTISAMSEEDTLEEVRAD